MPQSRAETNLTFRPPEAPNCPDHGSRHQKRASDYRGRSDSELRPRLAKAPGARIADMLEKARTR